MGATLTGVRLIGKNELDMRAGAFVGSPAGFLQVGFIVLVGAHFGALVGL